MDIERLGPYRIVGKLGRGGMGTVYKGIHSETGEAAAVKLLSAGLAQEEDFRIRFEGEIEALRNLKHPNIVRLLGFGEEQGHLFYAMELVEGASLEEELRRGRRFEWREVARFGIETCRALRHAHDRGIIHRDLKPGNLLLAADGSVKLSDFGIARLFGYSHLTSAGNVLGTAEYMAPEQADGRPVDARADMYSLGAVMYALLARRPVFRGKSLPEVLHKQRFEPPEPLRKYAPDVPGEMEDIIKQLLEKEPAKRITNANLLTRRLEAMLHALSTGPETVEAGSAWFEGRSSSGPSAGVRGSVAPEEMPATQVLDEEQKKQLELSRQGVSRPAPSEPTYSISLGEPEAKPPEKPSRFVTVAEHELDRAVEEPPQPWFTWQTVPLIVGLLLVWAVVWWMLQPPSAEALFDRIQTATRDGSIESLRGAKDDIEKYLQLFGGGPHAKEVQKLQDELKLDQLERDFAWRLSGRGGTRDLLPVELAYLEARKDEHLNPERTAAKLRALIDLYEQPKGDTGPTGECITLARRRLEKLNAEIKEQAATQLRLLQQRLKAADELRASDPARARAMYRAVIELYADKPWAAEVVREAGEAVDAMLQQAEEKL